MRRKQQVERWVLPQGAEQIIRQIAAEQILFELLGDIFSMAVVGQERKNAKRKAEFNTILKVVEEFPGTCQKVYPFRWEDGATRALYPLAAICCLRPPVDVVQAMYKANPEAISALEATRESMPLHYACGFGASLDVVRFLVTVYPSSISACRTDKVSPLHLACAYYKGGEPDVINFLLDEFPEGASQIATDMGWLPLHSAAHGGAHHSIIDRLCQLYPDSPTTPDSKGRTSLHIACERRGNYEGVKCLLKNAPQLADVEDDSRFTPLSLAAMHQSLDVLEMLLEFTQVLEDNHGVSLLHMAAFQNTVEVIDFLAIKYPQMLTARVRDSDMYTPLLAACRHEAPVEVVRSLIRHDPSTLNMPDGEGRPPIESARQAGADKAIIQVLQDELNAVAAAEFEAAFPQPVLTVDPVDPPTRDVAIPTPRSLLSTEPTYSIPELETTASFSSDLPSTSDVPSETVPSTPRSTVSAARCHPWRHFRFLRGLQFWRKKQRVAGTALKVDRASSSMTSTTV
eukprot:CAMPEP_0172474022 /NCGR_PEP_ID=MMETSP1065-20121228/69148_1 /TAXON_ID=265537 /ORGANISM="Amphiprora paludosa, Strain CCMP125" /LENGTH=512 /DNA_ID=CAMNT_0013232199 /DNA_START=100 /DNA_END=1638 /DNA_ORIENTATION=+